MMKPKRIPAAEIEDILSSLKVICYRAGNQIKVAIDEPTNTIYKRFPLQRGSWYRRLFNPASRKFIRHAERVQALGFKSFNAKGWYRGDDAEHDLIVYPALSGHSIYDLAKKGSVKEVLPLLAAYIAKLHERCIYFKAGHCGNFLYSKEDGFSLIDTENMRFRMGWRRRAVAIEYLFAHTEKMNVRFLEEYTHERFLKDYFAAANLSTLAEKYIRARLRRFFSADHARTTKE